MAILHIYEMSINGYVATLFLKKIIVASVFLMERKLFMGCVLADWEKFFWIQLF